MIRAALALIVFALLLPFGFGCFDQEAQLDNLDFDLVSSPIGCPVVLEQIAASAGRFNLYAEFALDFCTHTVWVCTEGSGWRWHCERAPIDPKKVAAFIQELRRLTIP